MLLIQSSDSDVEDVVRIANTDPGEIGKRLRQILKRTASEGFIALSDYRVLRLLDGPSCTPARNEWNGKSGAVSDGDL